MEAAERGRLRHRRAFDDFDRRDELQVAAREQQHLADPHRRALRQLPGPEEPKLHRVVSPQSRRDPEVIARIRQHRVCRPRLRMQIHDPPLAGRQHPQHGQ